jgi:hypothetical protein
MVLYYRSGRVFLTTYRRRVLFGGGAILALSFLAGIVLSFHQWDHGSPYHWRTWGEYNPLGRATYGPLAFAFVLFPVTVPVLLIVSVPIYIGLRKERLWPLSLLGFLSLGLLWLWYVTELWNFD